MLADKVRSAKGAAGGGGSATYYVLSMPSAGGVSPRIQPWTSASGFGVPYTIATGGLMTTDAAFTPDGSVIVSGSVGGRVAAAWPWSAAGLGTKYATDAVRSGWSGSTAFALRPDGTAIVAGRDTGPPYVCAFAFSTGAGFGAQLSGPAVDQGGYVRDINFSPDGNTVVSAGQGTQVNAWAFSSSGFGTKYTSPTRPLDNGVSTSHRIRFSPLGDAVVLTSSGSTGPWIAGYPWSNATGFGTQYSNPAVAVPSGTASLAFSPAGDAVAVGCNNSPYMQVYAFSAATGFGTKYANPATSTGSRVLAMEWSPTGTEILMSRLTPDALCFYRWSGAGFGTFHTDPNTATASDMKHIIFGTVPA